MKKPASLVAAIVFWFIALAQLLRVILRVRVTAGTRDTALGQFIGICRPRDFGALAVARRRLGSAHSLSRDDTKGPLPLEPLAPPAQPPYARAPRPLRRG
jgi:hypothetical protein